MINGQEPKPLRVLRCKYRNYFSFKHKSKAQNCNFFDFRSAKLKKTAILGREFPPEAKTKAFLI